jgi:hypothetical protein
MYITRNQRVVEQYHQPLYTTLARGVGNNTAPSGQNVMVTALAVMGIGGLAILLLTRKQRGEGLLRI